MNKVAAEDRVFRFGGHQSFALRTAWLPKAVRAIEDGEDVFSDPLNGVVRLGLGKNMVEALRVWVEAYGIASRNDGAWKLTDLGSMLFGAGGYDRFLEDEQTLWLLHWNISTLREGPFFAWELLVNRWSERFFTATEVMAAFAREAERAMRPLSPVSARQHLDVWLHTYLRGRNGRGEEGIDSPLTSLGLVARAGDRETVQGRREPVFAFDLEAKTTVSDELFAYCLQDWWARAYEYEETMSLAAIAFGHGAPGRVFRMPESEVLARLQRLAAGRDGQIELIESFNQYMVRRHSAPDARRALSRMFDRQSAAGLIDA